MERRKRRRKDVDGEETDGGEEQMWAERGRKGINGVKRREEGW